MNQSFAKNGTNLVVELTLETKMKMVCIQQVVCTGVYECVHTQSTDGYWWVQVQVGTGRLVQVQVSMGRGRVQVQGGYS